MAKKRQTANVPFMKKILAQNGRPAMSVRRQPVDENMMEQHDDRSPPAQAVEQSKPHRALIKRHSKAEMLNRGDINRARIARLHESLPSPP